MLNTLRYAAIVNLFWFSLPFIGYAIIKFSNECKCLPTIIRNVSSVMVRQHAFILFVLSFAVAVLVFSVLSVPLYLFRLPAVVPVAVYLALLSLSVLYVLTIFLKGLFKTSDSDIFRLRDQYQIVKVLFVVVVLALIFDFVLSTFILKAYPWGDAAYHMSRVVSIIQDGFSNSSSFHSNLPEGGYVYNVIYALHVIPAKLLSLEPMKINEYSLGFFRLLQWLSVFTLAMTLFGKWLKQGNKTMIFSFLAMLSAIAVYSNRFFIANYPNNIVNIWFVLLVVCLSIPIKKHMWGLGIVIMSISLLMATTHPTYSLIAACFILLTTLVRLLLLDRKTWINKTSSSVYLLSFFMLIAIPLMLKSQPVRLQASLLNLTELPTEQFLGLSYMKPYFPVDSFGWFMWTLAIVSLLYVLVKLWRSEKRIEATSLLSTMVFFPLIGFNPIVFTVMHHFLPVWFIERFNSMDIFVYMNYAIIAFFVYCIISWIIKRVNQRSIKIAGLLDNALICAVILVLAWFLGSRAMQTYRLLIADRKLKESTYLQIDQVSASLKDVFNDNKVVLSDGVHSYALNALFNIDVISIEYGHWPMASDGGDRDLCQLYLLDNLNYSDLSATGVDYVAISTLGDMEHTRLLAEEKPYLTFERSNQYYVVYRFMRDGKLEDSGAPKVYGPCLEYKEKESK